MTTIQWFPGHMAKARREVAEKLKYVDIVYEVVDARLPLSSRNPMLDQLIQQKPRLILLNKSDLADPAQTQEWIRYFTHEHDASLAINAKENKGINKILPMSKALLQEKRERQKRRGMKEQAIRGMCIGIPNCGKSTLLNRLAKKNIAKTGNKPGVTKGQQWLKYGSELELLDTPGILWPKFEEKEIGLKLALTGAIKDHLLHQDEIALFALEFFARFYPKELGKMLKVDEEMLFMSAADLLMKVTEQKGWKEDYERASEWLIQEIRSGKVGRYTLDRIEETEQLDD